MTVFTEGGLEITFNNVVNAQRFEDHGLTCLKAVDFLVELPDRFLFIEFKEPHDPEDYAERFKKNQLDQNLKYQYRDSFLYERASGRAHKDNYFYVLIALDNLKTADWQRRTDALKKALPVGLPGGWISPIANDCRVFSIMKWNQFFPDFPVRRLP